jgi:hypothetical protein
MINRSFSEEATSPVPRYVVLESCHEVHANRMAFQERRTLIFFQLLVGPLENLMTSLALAVTRV